MRWRARESKTTAELGSKWRRVSDVHDETLEHTFVGGHGDGEGERERNDVPGQQCERLDAAPIFIYLHAFRWGCDVGVLTLPSVPRCP